jgi:hypothetical protein
MPAGEDVTGKKGAMPEPVSVLDLPVDVLGVYASGSYLDRGTVNTSPSCFDYGGILEVSIYQEGVAREKELMYHSSMRRGLSWS